MNHTPIYERVLYYLPWQSVMQSNTFSIKSDVKLTIAGFTFSPANLYKNPKDYRVPVVFEGNIFGQEFLAQGNTIIEQREVVFDRDNLEGRNHGGTIKAEIKEVKMQSSFMLLPVGSRSLVWRPLFPSLKSAAYTLEVGVPSENAKAEGRISVEVNLRTANTVR